MSTQIKYNVGEYHVFVATHDFSLPNGRKMSPGTEVSFDGTNIKFEGMNPVEMMGFRGAVTRGWVVPKAGFDANAAPAKPQAAGIKIRPTQGGNPMNPAAREAITTVDAEEQEVGDVQNHAQRTRNLNASKKRTPPKRVEGVVMTTDENEGRVVNRPAFKTAAKNDAVSLDMAGEAIRETDITVDAMPSVVGKVAAPKNTEKEGFTVTNTVGNGVETFDLAGLDQKAPDQVTVVESEGLKFTTTNGPKKAVIKVDKKTEDVRRRVAKAVCSDFPDIYDFDASTRKKIARIQADFEDRPDVIKAIFAAESDDVKATLLEQFPEAFA